MNYHVVVFHKCASNWTRRLFRHVADLHGFNVKVTLNNAFAINQDVDRGSDRTLMKLVVNADDGCVLGAHILGPDAGEMAQLLAISLRMGATMADFNDTMAVHPTAAEELVTFAGPTERIRLGESVAA